MNGHLCHRRLRRRHTGLSTRVLAALIVQVGRCVECGAPVGGQIHRIREDNMPANDIAA